MKPGIGSYTFTWAVGVPGFAPDRPMDAFALLEAAARLGAKAAQFCDNLPLSRLSGPELRALQAEAESLGIAVEVGTRGLDPENLRDNLRLAVLFGCPFVRLVIDRPGDTPAPEEALARLRPLLPDFARAGVKLAVENHDRFPASVLARMVESLGTDLVGVCLDTVNSFGALEGPEAVIPVLAPHTLNLHVKDFNLRRMSHQMGFIIEGCPAGQGRLDIPRLLGQLAAVGRSEVSAVLELWTPPEASLEETVRKERRWAEESMAYLRGVVAGRPDGSPSQVVSETKMYSHPFKSRAERFLPCLALAGLPAAALANSGSPLMWATSGQLWVVNILIAMVESVVAKRLWGSLRHPFRLFLAANYFSTLIGWAFLATGGVWLWNVMIGEAPLYRALPAAWSLFALSWLLSVLLEWPFCFFMTGRGEGALSKALRISLAAQIASYAILVPYYYVFSNDTLYRDMDIRKDLSFVRRPAPVVYYIGLRDGDIWRIRADGTGRRKVREANITDPYARLTVRPHPGSKKGDIWLILKGGSARIRNPLLTEAASRFALHPDYLASGSERDSEFNFSSGPDFRPEGRREWTMSGDFWGGFGTDVRRNRYGVYKFGFDLPFTFYAARWNTGNFNYLPGDQAVFQMGPQILVLDMPGRKIAFLTAGRGPVAVYE